MVWERMVSIFPSIILCIIKFLISLDVCASIIVIWFFFFSFFLFRVIFLKYTVGITIIYVHGVRDRTVYDKKEKKNNKGEEVKKIVGWIWTSWRWPRFYEHCYADRVREWKKGGRRGMKRGVKGARMNGNTLLYKRIC